MLSYQQKSSIPIPFRQANRHLLSSPSLRGALLVLGRRPLRRRDGGGRAVGGAWADAAAPAVATLAGAKGRGGVGWGWLID